MSAQPPTSNPRAGFTVVELMVSTLASAILAVTAGALLFAGYTGWQRNGRSVDLQRDATYAMDYMSRLLRGAVATNVVAGGSTITVTLTNGTVTTLARVGNDLVYSDSATNSIVLVDEHVDLFAATLFTNTGVGVDMRLKDGTGQTRMYSLYTFRN
jgi:hypothetical protein